MITSHEEREREREGEKQTEFGVHDHSIHTHVMTLDSALVN